jgi:uncharacterized protein YeaO (DUF488 family)
MEIELIRSYDLVGQKKTSFRILVDRLWPRGLKKEDLAVDLWAKELSPSNELRKWYHEHTRDGGLDHNKWEMFRRRYFKELDENKSVVTDFISQIKGFKKIILVYSSVQREANNAEALKEYLSKLLA